MRKVEVIKLGQIIRMDKLRSQKPIIEIISDGGELIDYYNKILKDDCSDEYSFMDTMKIINQPMTLSGEINNGEFLDGNCDGYPIIGECYTINNSNWHTSQVQKIIDNNIIITKNSVYVIHTISELRDKKLKKLGI